MKNKLLSQLYESCKKWKTLVLLGAMLLIGINTAWAETLHVRGYNNNWSDQDFNLMTGNSSPWTFTATWNGNYGFKIFTDNSSAGDKGWLGNGNNITIGADPVEINKGGDMHIGSIVTGSEYTITVTKDGSTYKIQVTSGSSTPSYPERCIAGNGWGGLASWNNGHEDGRMDNNGDGTYTWTSSSVTAGTDCRFVICKWGTWDAIRYSNKVSGTNCSTAPHGESGDNSNICFVPANTGPITVTYDSSTGNVTITCAAAASNYTVTYAVGTSYTSYGGLTAYDNTSSSAVGASPATVTSGHSVIFTASPNTHYDVEGWYTNDACTSGKHDAGSLTYTTTINSDKDVYVKFKLKDYTITYKDKGGGAYSGNNSGSLIAKYNYGTGVASLVAGAKNGYTFVGWYANSGCTGSKVTSISNTASGNKTFYAKWTEKMTTVTINVSPAGAGTLTVGGAAFTTGNTTTAGVTTSRTVRATANSGYTFVGWGKEGNASGSSSTASITLKGNGSAGTGTLTAIFAASASEGWFLIGEPFVPASGDGDKWKNTNHDYPLNLKYRGMSDVYMRIVNFGGSSGKYYKPLNNSTQYGQNSGDDVAVVTGTQYSLIETSEEKTAFKTNGQSTVWCIVDETNKKYWIQSPTPYYPVTLVNGNSGNVLNGTEGTIALTTNNYGNLATMCYNVSERINISVTAKTGYWIDDISINGTSLVENRNSASWSGYTNMPSSDAVLTVTYNRIYTLNYYIGSVTGTAGSITSSPTTATGSTVINGSVITLTAPTEKTGYSWKGWYLNNGGSGVQQCSTKAYAVTVSEDKTLYACYTEDMHTVALGNDGHGHVEIGGATVEEVSGIGVATASNTITAVPDDGYYFVNWTGDINDGVTLASGSATSASITIRATADSKTLTANFAPDEKIYFDNTYSKWSNVYVYLFNDNTYWTNSKENGVHPKDHLPTGFAPVAMTKVAGTDNLYEYAYHTSSHNYSFSYVAFSEVDMHNYNVFGKDKHAVYRGDWHKNLPVYVATEGYERVQIDKDDAAGGGYGLYHSGGYWRPYNPKAGESVKYYLDVFSGTADFQGETQFFKASGDGSLVAEVSARLTDANTTYTFGVHSDAGGSNNQHYAESTTITNDNSDNYLKLYKYNDKWNISVETSAEGIYTFVLSMEYDSLRFSVIYPASVGDYRLTYSYDSPAKTRSSDIIKKKVADTGDAIKTSMYVDPTNAYSQLILERCSVITDGKPVWETRKTFNHAYVTSNFASKGVYEMDITIAGTTGDASTLTNIAKYSGPYYIKTDGTTGGWANYKENYMSENTLNYDPEHPEESFNYYYCKYYSDAGTNLKCVIANDYCNALTDTLKGDAVIGIGSQTTPSAANVRFSYNNYTNEIKRAYLGSSVNSDFLCVKGNTTASTAHIYDKDESSPGDATADASIKFEDKQNWRYEIVIKADANARAKLTAVFNGQTQYFWGLPGESGSEWDNENTVQLFGGSDGTYGLTLVYDFKTNKLINAWTPTGDAVNSDLSLNSDVLLLREHQEAPKTITFGKKDATNYASLTEVKTAYCVLRFNRWKLSNRARPDDLNSEHCKTPALIDEYHPALAVDQDDAAGKWLPIHERELYFISFPYDVKMSDIISFGTYYDTWGIMYYDGKGRAKNGYWIDSEPNWKYFTPEEYATKTLKAYEGYLIGIDLATMWYNNTSFWTNNSSEADIYFPSSTAVSSITQKSVTVDIDTTGYQCTINRTYGGNDGDRRIKDSHWHCIGVPAYANITHDINNGEPADETWSNKDLLYLYEWDTSTNDHTIKEATDYSFQAMYAYLVQYAGKTLTWAAAATGPSSIVAKRMKTEELRDRQFDLQLMQGNKKADHTYIRLSDDEEVTTGFEFNYDVSKMMLSGANIYTLIGKEQAAANSLPLNLEQTTVVPVGVKIAATGDYTFAIPEGTEGIGVVLVDNETGTRTNLGLTDYEVNLSKGTYDERFVLEISPIMHTPTGIDNIGVGAQDGIRKVMVDGILYIVKEGVVYDAQGKRVK